MLSQKHFEIFLFHLRSPLLFSLFHQGFSELLDHKKVERRLRAIEVVLSESVWDETILLNYERKRVEDRLGGFKHITSDKS
jgi:hypothetical protein